MRIERGKITDAMERVPTGVDAPSRMVRTISTSSHLSSLRGAMERNAGLGRPGALSVSHTNRFRLTHIPRIGHGRGGTRPYQSRCAIAHGKDFHIVPLVFLARCDGTECWSWKAGGALGFPHEPLLSDAHPEV